MQRTGFTVTDRIVNDVQVVVADLKRIYFTNKEPLNDDEIQIQKLCVYLEKALRYGARGEVLSINPSRNVFIFGDFNIHHNDWPTYSGGTSRPEKYTFRGTRKDYWNYIHDCISKDETIKYIQSIQELKTNQGKGRAFLRQALVEKSLADALQRCVINARLTKEYYVIDSVFRNNQRFEALLHSLYDLNSVEFVLPHEGYDLDRSWPSFSRKNAPVSRTSSVTSIEQSPPESDPILILNTVINSLSRTLNKWRGVNNTEINKDNCSPRLQEMIDKMLLINEDVIKLKTISENEIIGLNKDLMRIKKEKENIVKRSEENIKEIHDRYLNLQSSDKTSENLRDVFDQLRTTESNLVKTQNEKACLEDEVERLKLSLEDSENEKSELTIENENLISNLQAIDHKLKNAKLSLASNCSSFENKIAEDRVGDSDLQPEEIGGVDAPDNAVVDEMFIDQLIRTIMRLPKLVDDDEGYDYADGMIKKYKLVAKEEQKEIMKKLAEVQKELATSKEEKKKYEDEIETLKKEVECLLKRIDGDWDESKNSEENIRPSELIKLRLEKEELEKRCQELEREIPELNVTIKTLDENTAIPGENAEAVRNGTVSESEHIAEVKDESDIESRLLQEKYEKLNKENDELKDQLTSVSAEAEKYEKSNKENDELKEQLTSALAEAEAFRVEVEMVKKEMENAASIKDSEIKTLKFELSSLEIKTETAQKELSDLKSEHEALMNDLSVRESNIKEIEKEQSLKNLAWNNEKASLETKCKELNEKLSTYERELQILKAELAKLAQEKELDKNTKLNLTNRISNLLEERKEMESKFKTDLEFIEQENKDLKDHLVNITRDKHNLWHKSEILELELKSRGKERWVKDDEVTYCTNCQDQFSVTLRKHHCRLCGQIFCHACSNRWIRTHHSSKRLRSCNACADGYQESHPESVYDVVDGAANDTTSERGSFISFVNPNDLEENTGDQTNILSDESVEDTFVVLDPKSVSSSGSFGPREEIQVKPADLRKDSVVPVVENLTQSNGESIKETVNMTLAAGQRCLLPIVICATNFELIWEFASTPKDTGFGIAFKVNEEELDEKIQTIIPLSRYISHKQTIHGKMKIGKPGIYYLMFDNSFSRITAKYITCSFMLMLSTN